MLIAVTVLSLAVAIVMTVVAWRLAREEQRRSDARVSALAADLYDDDNPTPVRVSDLFDPDARPRTRGSLVKALGIGVVVVGTLITLVVVSSSGPASRPGSSVLSAAGSAQHTQRTPPIAATPPLELTALGHDRDRNELSVRGIVRNPEGAATVGPLMVMVSVFNRQGDLVASGKAPIERTSLSAGVESRFVVRISDASDVYRYRVSFAVDNRTVAHVDRRDRLITAQLP
jgi:hypothetical protein